jgi:flagellar motor protein MotB
MSEPFSVRRKVRPARPTQKKPAELAEEGHAWAVSYADFLMVLLSFFILFFSMDKNDRTSFIEDFLARQNEAKEQKEGRSAPLGGSEKAGSAKSAHNLPVEVRLLAEKLEGFHIEQKSTDRMTISFADNIYRLGSFDLDDTNITILYGLLKKLEPHMKKVNITFVGHTDGTTSFRGGNRYVGNNFDLSSLRATKALQKAVKFGFDPRQMFAQGVAEHERASRTLSLIVSPGGRGP